MEGRKILIQNKKNKIDTLLELCNTNYTKNINDCNLLLNEYAHFIKIIKITNIVELYKWHNFISEYKSLKSKINKDNKLINEISNIFSDTNSYYTTTQSYNINILIHKYEELKETVIITFGFLKHEHHHLSRFISNTRRNKMYILIDKDYDNIIQQLYNINIKINEINKELILIKRKQATIITYIRNIKTI